MPHLVIVAFLWIKTIFFVYSLSKQKRAWVKIINCFLWVPFISSPVQRGRLYLPALSRYTLLEWPFNFWVSSYELTTHRRGNNLFTMRKFLSAGYDASLPFLFRAFIARSNDRMKGRRITIVWREYTKFLRWNFLAHRSSGPRDMKSWKKRCTVRWDGARTFPFKSYVNRNLIAAFRLRVNEQWFWVIVLGDISRMALCTYTYLRLCMRRNFINFRPLNFNLNRELLLLVDIPKLSLWMETKTFPSSLVLKLSLNIFIGVIIFSHFMLVSLFDAPSPDLNS